MGCFFAGNIIWTILEYTLHRFLFHVDHYLPEANWAMLLHFLLHGIHHYLPMDRLRLVMPPTLFLALETPFTKLAHVIFPKAAANGIIAGAFTFYILYDCMHYALHHTRLPQYMAEMKRYHLAHHYKSKLTCSLSATKLIIRLRARLWSYLKDLGLCFQHCLTYRYQVDVSNTLAIPSLSQYSNICHYNNRSIESDVNSTQVRAQMCNYLHYSFSSLSSPNYQPTFDTDRIADTSIAVLSSLLTHTQATLIIARDASRTEIRELRTHFLSFLLLIVPSFLPSFLLSI